LLDDVVPSGQSAKRLQPTDAGGEGLRSETDRAVVRADRIDAPTNLAQQLRPAGPRGRVSVALAERLVVGSQRFVVLVRGPEDVSPEPPRVRVIWVQLDHAVEASDGPLRLARGEVRERFSLQGLLAF